MDRRLYLQLERVRNYLVISATGLQHDPSWMTPLKHTTDKRIEFAKEALALLDAILCEGWRWDLNGSILANKEENEKTLEKGGE